MYEQMFLILNILKTIILQVKKIDDTVYHDQQKAQER